MALTVADVLSPAGDINGAVWFPALASGAVDTLVTGYITDAESKTDDPAAQEQWVYYRAATAVAERMTTEQNVSGSLVDQGSVTSASWLQAQIQYWIDKAAAYLSAFEAAIAEVVDDPPGGFHVLTSLRHG